jgi:hypothetical protein
MEDSDIRRVRDGTTHAKVAIDAAGGVGYDAGPSAKKPDVGNVEKYFGSTSTWTNKTITNSDNR